GSGGSVVSTGSSSGGANGTGSSGGSGSSSGSGSSGSSGGSGSSSGSGSSGGSGSSSGVSAGQSDGGADGGGGASFSQVYSIMQSRCLPCHANGAGFMTGHLDMSSKATAYSNLVGVKAAGTACANTGETRVVAGSPTTSLMYQMLNPAPPCGMQMPRTGGPLTAPQIAQVSSWIASGAPNN
ncbi:MAG: hypothetical protein M3O46_16300, partial [Myxococcota bacterium]|nr:hypothetical protein [Myxococcota bacterium]